MVRRDRALEAAAALAAVVIPALLLRPPPMPLSPAPAKVAPVTLSVVPPMPAASLFVAAPESAAGDGPQLVGIAGRLPDDAVALVRIADGRTRPLRPGESIDGWTLASLSADAAAFTRGGERVRVALPAGE